MSEADLNPGRDLRAEARQATLDAVEAAKTADSRRASLDSIMRPLDSWIGGTDWVSDFTGKGRPIRPQSVFDGVGDAFIELDPSKMQKRHVIALLTITNPVKSRISGRTDFYERAWAYYKKTCPKRVKGLLGGLR